jgi:hypothetical protein
MPCVAFEPTIEASERANTVHTLDRSATATGPRPLYPRGKSPQYPLDRRLGGPQSRSERRGEEKILDPTGVRTPTPRSSSRYIDYATPAP